MTYVKNRRKTSMIRNIFRFIVQLLILLFVAANLLNFRSILTSDNRNATELATQVETITEYNFIRTIAPYAQESQKKYNVLSSLTLAQAALESNFGQSGLAAKYYNIFGIKAYGDVPTVTLETKEFENNKWITIQAKFRVYDSWKESVEGHAYLFTKGTTWNPKQYASVLAAQNYKEAAQAVQTSGYATDPAYTEKLIQMIESYGLDQYDKI
ncbi:glycoside hydrolase family 73 protein [Lactococcus garvieae]|uniref:glycoside hydrolase family 73 protein n=1 Tax=Lactococcus garvieae TaxID=1363 RepID=UPI001179E6A7|nr:glycoside hydrolase family 73 protein [Lactococcus garvieae]